MILNRFFFNVPFLKLIRKHCLNAKDKIFAPIDDDCPSLNSVKVRPWFLVGVLELVLLSPIIRRNIGPKPNTCNNNNNISNSNNISYNNNIDNNKNNSSNSNINGNNSNSLQILISVKYHLIWNNLRNIIKSFPKTKLNKDIL